MPISRFARRNLHYEALNAFVAPKPLNEAVLQAAARRRGMCLVEDPTCSLSTDTLPVADKVLSPIDGLLIAVKDNICTADRPTTCASHVLKDFVSPYDATVVRKLRAAGAIFAGKTNLDEFGMGSNSTHSIHGPVKNNYTRNSNALSAGGSSGGSAVAVATGQCHAALGTDTGGSIRLPAAYTGIVGFKPSYGLVSRWGVVAYANSLDTVGILAKTVGDAKKVFDVIQGYDFQDPTSLTASTRSKIMQQIGSQRKTNGSPEYARSMRIGVPKEYNTMEIQPAVRKAWIRTLQRLKKSGHSIHVITLPATKLALSAYYVLAPAEASSNLAKYDGVRYGKKATERDSRENVLFASTRGDGLGEEVKRRILLGSYSLSAAAIDNYFIQAQKVRRLVQQDFNRTFDIRHPLQDQLQESSSQGQGVDVILTPTAQSLPPELHSVEDSVDSYSADVLTVSASLAGLPAASVPVSDPEYGRDDANPIGLQIMAQYGDDDSVLKLAEAIDSLKQT